MAQTQTTQDRLQQASELYQKGIKQLDEDRYREAIETLDQVLVMTRQIGNHQLEAHTLKSLGRAYHYLEQYQQEIECYQQWLRIAQQIGDREEEASALRSLGRAYASLGRFQQTIRFYQQWLDIARATGNRKKEAEALGQLGSTYVFLGQYQQAIECYQQWLSIVRQIGDPEEEASALRLLCASYLLPGQYQQAIECYQQQLSIARRVGNREDELSTLLFLSNVYTLSGQYQQAIRLLQQQLDIARQTGERKLEAMFIGLLGMTYEWSGQDQQALGFYQQELDIARQLGNSQDEAAALIGLGRILLKSGKLIEAEQTLFAAIKILESQRESFDDIQSNYSFKKSEYDYLNVTAFESDVVTYKRLQEALVLQNKTDTALEISERGRAKVFVNLLASRLLQNSNNQPIIEPLTIQQIKLIAREQNATLVEYSIIDNAFKIPGGFGFKRRELKLFIWVVKPTGEVVFKQVDLKSLNTSLKDLVTSSRDSIGIRGRGLGVEARVNATIQAEQLQQLYKLLIEPIAQFLPTNPRERVIFIPQNELFLVPFPALKDDRGKYLIEKYTILTAPSIQLLQLTREKRRSVTGTNALVVGNPTMPNNLITSSEEQVQLPPLPGAEKEALAIANLFNTKAITGNQATKLAVTKQMEKARIIHLATHGLLDDFKGRGVPGAIALAPSGKDDGLLTSSEILDMKLNAELVVLSACNTGRGAITGDGVIGLSRSLIAAGVPSVIISLWSVPDAPTAELMTEFYRQLQQTPDKAQALRQAMLTTMKQHPNPRDWAAFTLIGESN